MNKKRLLCIVLSLTAVFSMFFIKDSAAWIDSKTGEPVGQEISVKKLKFEFNGTLGSYLYTEEGKEYIITDRNLIIDNGGKITGVNHSTVDTEVRWRINYNFLSQGEVVNKDYRVSEKDHLFVDYDDDIWEHKDGYFYGSFNASEKGQSFDIIKSIYYNSKNMKREEYLPKVDGKIEPFDKANITIQIQAKQEDFVGWEDIGWETIETISA